MKHLLIILLLCVSCVGSALAQEPRTEITKWQDGKPASMAITYDDSTLNQFRIALPLMNERGV